PVYTFLQKNADRVDSGDTVMFHCRTVYGIGDVSGRLPARRGGKNYVCTCAGGLDGAGRLYVYCLCQFLTSRVEESLIGYPRTACRADWCDVYTFMPDYRKYLGKAYLGSLVGMGCQAYVDA